MTSPASPSWWAARAETVEGSDDGHRDTVRSVNTRARRPRRQAWMRHRPSSARSGRPRAWAGSLAPYTSELETCTKRRYSGVARSLQTQRSVPVALTSCVSRGECKLNRTPRQARWKTVSTVGHQVARASLSSRTSPVTLASVGQRQAVEILPAPCRPGCRARPRSHPRATNCATSSEPMKPAPPVTRARLNPGTAAPCHAAGSLRAHATQLASRNAGSEAFARHADPVSGSAKVAMSAALRGMTRLAGEDQLQHFLEVLDLWLAARASPLPG